MGDTSAVEPLRLLDDELRDYSRGAICRAFGDTCAVEPLRLLVWS